MPVRSVYEKLTPVELTPPRQVLLGNSASQCSRPRAVADLRRMKHSTAERPSYERRCVDLCLSIPVNGLPGCPLFLS